MKINSQSLKEIVDDKIFRGVSTGKNEVFIINKSVADDLINDKNKSFIRKIVTGKEVKRNCLTFDNLYLLYIPWEYELDFDENIKQYLLTHKDLLSNRPEVKEGRFNWWCLSRYGSKNAEYLFKPKIIYPRINNQCDFYFDHTGEYSLSDNNFFISTEVNYLLPILNSKLVYFYLKSIASTLQGGYLDFRRPYIETIPIKKPKNNAEYEIISKNNIHLNNDFQEKNTKFTKYLQSQFAIEKPTKKLENWYDLDFGDFIKEINNAIKAHNKGIHSLEKNKDNNKGMNPLAFADKKNIKELTKLDEMDWMDVFETKKAEAQNLKQQIVATDKEIDAMVYELYGLTAQEIAIVENS